MTDVGVFVFSSKSITNIWAGYGAQTWAVAIGSDQTNKGKRTKAAKMPIGSFGLLYCEPWAAFTVPFVTCTRPDQEGTEAEIWDKAWMLPFQFRPLGSPRKRLAGHDLLALPGAKERQVANFSNYLNVQGNFAFQTSKIDLRDWEYILERLVF